MIQLSAVLSIRAAFEVAKRALPDNPLTVLLQSFGDFVSKSFKVMMDFLIGGIFQVPVIETKNLPLPFGEPVGVTFNGIGGLFTADTSGNVVLPTLMNHLLHEGYYWTWLGEATRGGGFMTALAIVIYMILIGLQGQYDMLSFKRDSENHNKIVGAGAIIFWYPMLTTLTAVTHGFVNAVVDMKYVVLGFIGTVQAITTIIQYNPYLFFVVGIILIVVLIPYFVVALVMGVRAIVVPVGAIFGPFLMAGLFSDLPLISKACKKATKQLVSITLLPLALVPVWFLAEVVLIDLIGNTGGGASAQAGIGQWVSSLFGSTIGFGVMGFAMLLAVYIAFTKISPATSSIAGTAGRAVFAAGIIGVGKSMRGIDPRRVSKAAGITMRAGPVAGAARLAGGAFGEQQARRDVSDSTVTVDDEDGGGGSRRTWRSAGELKAKIAQQQGFIRDGEVKVNPTQLIHSYEVDGEDVLIMPDQTLQSVVKEYSGFNFRARGIPSDVEIRRSLTDNLSESFDFPDDPDAKNAAVATILRRVNTEYGTDFGTSPDTDYSVVVAQQNPDGAWGSIISVNGEIGVSELEEVGLTMPQDQRVTAEEYTDRRAPDGRRGARFDSATISVEAGEDISRAAIVEIAEEYDIDPEVVIKDREAVDLGDVEGISVVNTEAQEGIALSLDFDEIDIADDKLWDKETRENEIEGFGRDGRNDVIEIESGGRIDQDDLRDVLLEGQEVNINLDEEFTQEELEEISEKYNIRSENIDKTIEQQDELGAGPRHDQNEETSNRQRNQNQRVESRDESGESQFGEEGQQTDEPQYGSDRLVTNPEAFDQSNSSWEEPTELVEENVDELVEKLYEEDVSRFKFKSKISEELEEGVDTPEGVSLDGTSAYAQNVRYAVAERYNDEYESEEGFREGSTFDLETDVNLVSYGSEDEPDGDGDIETDTGGTGYRDDSEERNRYDEEGRDVGETTNGNKQKDSLASNEKQTDNNVSVSGGSSSGDEHSSNDTVEQHTESNQSKSQNAQTTDYEVDERGGGSENRDGRVGDGEESEKEDVDTETDQVREDNEESVGRQKTTTDEDDEQWSDNESKRRESGEVKDEVWNEGEGGDSVDDKGDNEIGEVENERDRGQKDDEDESDVPKEQNEQVPEGVNKEIAEKHAEIKQYLRVEADESTSAIMVLGAVDCDPVVWEEVVREALDSDTPHEALSTPDESD